MGLLGIERRHAELETLDSLDTKATVFERGPGLAGQMAAAGERRPHRRISGPLQGSAKRLLRRDVLIEAKIAAGPNDAVQFCDGPAGVPDRAQHQRGDGSVDAGVLEWKVLGDSVSHLHRNRRVIGGPRGQAAKIWVGFEGRLLAAGWPRPAPFRECYMCSVVRKWVAYEPVDWVAPRPKPIKLPKPKPPLRKSLHARLKKLQAETEQLREQLKKLDE